MAIAIFPLVLAIVGALVYALSTNGKAAEVGRACLWAGLFALAFALASRTIHLG